MEHEKRLFVEGNDDCHAILHLMRSYIEWPRTQHKENWPLEIVPCGGHEMYTSTRIPLALKGDGWRSIGIVVDADADSARRWNQVRNLCAEHFPAIGETIPPEGGVWQNQDGRRLGVWLMPDNQSRGMLETFLRFLVPSHQEPIWQHAQHAVTSAINVGATCRDKEKSDIYTWLAWQDPPGQSFGRALQQTLLDPCASRALPFVRWFITLFELDGRMHTHRRSLLGSM